MKPYVAALREAASHVVAHLLAPALERRDAVLPDVEGVPPRPVLRDHGSPVAKRVEAMARFAGPSAALFGARVHAPDDDREIAQARALIGSLGEEAHEDDYRRESDGMVQAHFLTIRALALQLLQSGTLSSDETGLIIDVAEGRTPRRVLDEYRISESASSSGA